jgi:hypothetical protein
VGEQKAVGIDSGKILDMFLKTEREIGWHVVKLKKHPELECF